VSCGLEWPRVDSLPVLFSLYVNDVNHTLPTCRVRAVRGWHGPSSPFSQPELLVGYPEAYLGRVELWLWDWRIAINLSKCTIVFFVKTARSIQKPIPMQLIGQPMQWIETARYLGVTLDTRLIW
jgi:hypothetical protein